MPIPWNKIILHGPQVLDAAKNLYGNWQTRSRQSDQNAGKNEEHPSRLDTAFFRLQTLEDAGEKQAALATDLAEQNQALSIGLSTLNADAEEMKKKVEEIRHVQSLVDERLNELSDRMRQENDLVAEINRKITRLILVSASALAVSILALLLAFYK
jgi:DNA repair ATPase RecN